MGTTNQLNTRILLLNGTQTEWSSEVAKSYVLRKGEPAIEFIPTVGTESTTLTAVKVKVGDGFTAYENLPYVGDELKAEFVAKFDELIADIKVAEGDIDSINGTIATLTSDVNTLKEDVADNSSAIETAQSNIEALQQTTSTISTKVDELEAEHATFASIDDVATAKEEAVTEAVAQIMGEAGIDEKYDTLKEIADWILTDPTNSAELVTKVDTIESDYLKNADKVELQTSIDNVTALVGTLPEGAVSTTVIDYISEVITSIDTDEYAKASDLSALAETVTQVQGTVSDATTRISTLEDELSSRADIKSVDSTSIVLNESGVLSVGTISQDAVTGLPAALSGKVDKVTSEYNGEQKEWILLSPENQAKLASLVIGENGIEVSGKVNADNVEGLASWITENKNTVDGLVSDEIYAKVNSAIQGVSINDVVISANNSIVNLPLATNTAPGLIKGVAPVYSGDEITNPNTVSINENGELEVNAINVSKLVQSEDEELILFGGSASSIK